MTDQTAPAPAAALSQAEIHTILIGIFLAMLLAALDQTIIATALPTIGREFGDMENLSWVATIYLIAATVVTPLYGKFSDIHGRRVTLLIGISTFVVGSVACALAPNMLALIIARGVQGLGGGGLISLAQTIVGDMLPPRERSRYQVFFSGVFMTASLAGPVLGGFFAEHLHWSLIFWINVPMGVIALWMSNSCLKRLPRHERRHTLDVAGAVLMVIAALCFMMGLSWGGVRYAWTSPQILGLAAGWLVFTGLFVLRLNLSSEPLIPPTVFRNQVVRMGTLAGCFGMGTYIGLTIFLPVYFETVRGLSAAQSGLALIPLMAGTVVGAATAGRFLSKGTRYKRLPLAGLAVAMAGCGSLALFADDLPLAAIEIILAGISVGLGTLLPVQTVSIQNAVELHELGTATATSNFARSLGGALLVAVFGAIVVAGTGLHGADSAEALASKLSDGSGDFGAAFRLVFAAAVGGFALAFLALLAMEEKPLRSSFAAPDGAPPK